MEASRVLNKNPDIHNPDAVNKVAFFFGAHGRSARTPEFEALGSQHKFNIYESLAEAIDLDPTLLKGKKTEINLVGENGISLKDGKINIGVGVTGEGIINFLRNQPEEEAAPSPTSPEPDESINLNGEEKKPEELQVELTPELAPEVDISDVVVQSPSTPEDYKYDMQERVQYFRPQGPRPSAFSSVVLANELRPREESNVEFAQPASYGSRYPSVEKDSELSTKLEILKEDLRKAEKVGIEKDDILQQKEDEIKKLEVLIQIDQWRRQKDEIRSELEAMEKDGHTKDEVLESKLKEIKRIEDIIRNLENPKTQDGVSVEDEQVEAVKPKTEEILVGELVPVTSGESTTNPNNISTPVQNWRESEEWKKFEQMREDLARADAPIDQLGMSSIGLEINRSEYRNYKETVAKKIEETLRRQAGSNLTPEQERVLEQEIHDTIYEELLKKESDTYLDTFRKHKSESLKDKVKEAAFSLLNTKLARWYLGKNRLTKFAINSALFGAALGVGTFAAGGTAIGVLGAVGYRTARAAGSLVGSTLGATIGPKIENVEKWEKEEEEKIKNSHESLEEKTKKFEELKKQAENKKRNLALKKSAITFGLGAGAGVAVGGFLDSYYGGLSLKNELHPNAPKVPTEDQLKSINEKIYAENAPQLLSPENLKHMPEKGDSNWGLLRETMEHNDRFAKLEHSGQKSLVISYLNNRVLGDPSKYAEGVGKNGEILIGKEVNYSKLFEDKKWINEILEKAEKLPENRIKIIEENDAKIAAWVKDPSHQGQNLDSKTVDEILNTKPKAEPIVIMDKGDSFRNLGEDINETEVEMDTEEVVGLSVDANADSSLDREMQDKIESAKAGILTHENKTAFEVIEGGKGKNAMVEAVRSLEGDTKRVIAEMITTEEVEKHFNNDINTIYGKEGFLGIGKQEGISSPEWKEIAPQNASKVLDYYKHPEDSELPKKIVESLSVSQSHRNLIGYIDFLRKEAMEGTKASGASGDGVDVIPYKDENMVDYVKRLGKFVAEHPRPKPTDVAPGKVVDPMIFKRVA